MFKNYPYFAQHDTNDCGPACLKMVAKFYGKDYSLDKLREYAYINGGGVSLLGISEGAEKIGFHTLMVKTSYEKLLNDVPLPSILHWDQEHFIVLYERTAQGMFNKKKTFKIADPNGAGVLDIDEGTFKKKWLSDADEKGVLLALYPTEKFYDPEDEQDEQNTRNNTFTLLKSYLKPYKKQLLILLASMVLGSLLSLAFPFLNQFLIDSGIRFKSKNILLLILLAQLAIFAGNTIAEISRNMLFVHVSNRLGIQMVSDYLKKLMRLPVKFFDIRSAGDINQRIQDHDKIETFLTSTAVTTIFSIFNILVFGIILLIFSPAVFFTFFAASVLSILWLLLFQKKRKSINYRRFQILKNNQDNVLEIINGIKEIKLNNSEIARRWIWERNQIKKYKINILYFNIEQWQKTGFDLINQLKNIFVIFILANLVMQDALTIGTMLSILYITGQLNSPLYQLIDFFRMYQDAKISFERRSDINNIKEEGSDSVESEVYVKNIDKSILQDITLTNVSFQYSSPKAPPVLENISITIPKHKITAIVGPSGCGKTTLLKLLLKFYDPVKGSIKIGDDDLRYIDDKAWRSKCGTVMQDGYIFADTISRNIVTDGSTIDAKMLERAVTIANIKDYINVLPLRYTTKLGMNGAGLSAGQKQRILIARAVYKNPEYLFFDEATSALDARNERVIIENLNEFFKGKTVVVVAHRLSTVKNADQIIVMNDGEVVEIGTHSNLITKQGFYYELVRNQLELGN